MELCSLKINSYLMPAICLHQKRKLTFIKPI